MFSWIIAGFIVLVAKSIRVREWPWRDFLLGRVTCRIVREIANVTGLDAQEVLLYLLSSEARTPLRSRGPYNSIFTFVGDGEGFSIDVQPTVATMVSSGILIVKVMSDNDPVLICLDLRPEAGHRTIDSQRHNLQKQVPHQQNQAIWCLACASPPRDDREAELSFRMRKLRWKKVLGVYDEECRLVR
ncbi:hypothetical protein CSPX01_00525 [Colletotrichum filicis]|nr:hypothetical protein CSPX01_00525 [Colletotrichum filicis]